MGKLIKVESQVCSMNPIFIDADKRLVSLPDPQYAQEPGNEAINCK